MDTTTATAGGAATAWGPSPMLGHHETCTDGGEAPVTSVSELAEVAAEVARRCALAPVEPGSGAGSWSRLVRDTVMGEVLAGGTCDVAWARRWAIGELAEAHGMSPSWVLGRWVALGADPSLADGPDEVARYAVEDAAAWCRARAQAAWVGQAVAPTLAGRDDRLLSRRWEVPGPMAELLWDDGAVTVVSLQHRDVVARGGVVPDASWRRPLLDGWYRLMEAEYARRSGRGCDRLVWAHSDPLLVTAALAAVAGSPGAMALLDARAAPGEVAVVARVPRERLVATSELRWERWVLRGRYAARDVAEARAFFDQTGTTRLAGLGRMHRAVLMDSWRGWALAAVGDDEVGGQVALDHIAAAEVVHVVAPTAPAAGRDGEPGLVPSRVGL